MCAGINPIARALDSVKVVDIQLKRERERRAHELQEYHHDRKQSPDSSNELRLQIQALKIKHKICILFSTLYRLLAGVMCCRLPLR
jgi:hypothetical protein